MKWNLSVEDKLEIFKKRGAEIHQGKDSYEKSIYKSANEDIIVTCLIHGDYTITPHRYLNKKNRCAKCSNYKKLSIDDWKLKCNEKYNNQYDYSNVYFKTTSDIVNIKCKSCGNEFSVTANSHLLGKKCPVCSKNSQSKTLEDYTSLGNSIHNNKYKYLDVYIEDSRAILKIECPEHGVFTQKACYHINLKCGCPKCASNYKGSTEKFIEQSKTIHGDIFDYSKVDYKSTNDYVILICKVCGHEFLQTPHSHITGKSGCPNCAGKVKINMKERIDYMSKLTRDELIERFKKKHGDFYDYSKVIFNGLRNYITIICPVHGEFQQIAYNHQFNGCKKCYEDTRKIIKEKIIQKFLKIHGDLYDYSKVSSNIKSYTDKVEIICKKHGSFFKIIDNHLKGQGCPECYKEKNRTTTEKIVSEFRKIHGEKYNYDKVVFVGHYNNVTISCPIHGDFQQSIYTHKKGCGCPICGKKSQINSSLSNQNDVIDKLKKVHENKYYYDKSIYNGMREKIIITCPIHGDFEQLVCNHLYRSNGCPKCAYESTVSKQEQELFNTIHEFFPDAVQSERNIIKGEIDIYIPSKKVGIEFNGTYYHSEIFRDKEYHYNKSMECEEKGIRLIHIWEYEWNNERQRPILINIIKNSLGMNAERIYARKCQIKILETSEVKYFFEKNNIQGFRGGKFAICLFHENEIVMSYIMGACFFGKGKYEWEVIRGATKLGVTVIGGASKIWNYFINTYNPKNCVYYIDFNYFNGNSLKHLNLEYLQTKPSFKNYWVKTGIVKNREPFRHKEIKELRERGEVVQINNAGVKVYKYERKD